MPHMCTKCGKVYEDASEILLHGCPECGWNKFLYIRDPKEAKSPTVTEYVKKKEEEVEKRIKEVEKTLKKEKSLPEGTLIELEGLSPEDVETIRIIEPGRYELNLNALFEREEIIVALGKNGTYVIHLPSLLKKKPRQEENRE